jgi:outer membrane protein TolC
MTAKHSVTAILCILLVLAPAPGVAQQGVTSTQPLRPVGGLWQPYTYRGEAPVALGNSSRLDSLVRGGNLYLSLQDAIALALENNLDIALQRYTPRIADTDIVRAKSGGRPSGVTTAISSLSTPTSGSSIGTTNVPSASTGSGGLGGYSLEPTVSYSTSWAHQTVPQSSSFVTGTSSLITTNTLSNFSIQKGFLTGTNAALGWSNTFTKNNSGRNDFNPSTTANLSLQVTQHLLEGFGRAFNDRYIRIAQNSRKVSDLFFQQQVIATVAAVMNLYWDLVSFNEDVKVRLQAVALAEKLLGDNKKQVEIGTLAPIEVVRAEAQLASSQQDLVVSQTRVFQQETIIKNAVSRTGVGSPVIADARIVPTDQINIPATERIEPIQDLMKQAMANRPDVAQTAIQIENTKIGLKGTKSEMLPALDLVGSLQNSALAGQVNALPAPPGAVRGAVSPYFLGSYDTVAGQLLRRNFPNYSIGVQLTVPLGNKTAQADMIRDQLTLRQQEIRQQMQVNQVRVDVTNALIAVQQARAGYETAVKARILQEQTLAAEQKKYELGASTNFLVIQSQRDLAAAQSIEVAARSNYTKAAISLDQSTGRILSSHNIRIEEAVSGQVSQPPSPLPPAGSN